MGERRRDDKKGNETKINKAGAQTATRGDGQTGPKSVTYPKPSNAKRVIKHHCLEEYTR
jgi:hypothetical protein